MIDPKELALMNFGEDGPKFSTHWIEFQYPKMFHCPNCNVRYDAEEILTQAVWSCEECDYACKKVSSDNSGVGVIPQGITRPAQRPLHYSFLKVIICHNVLTVGLMCWDELDIHYYYSVKPITQLKKLYNIEQTVIDTIHHKMQKVELLVKGLRNGASFTYTQFNKWIDQHSENIIKWSPIISIKTSKLDEFFDQLLKEAGLYNMDSK